MKRSFKDVLASIFDVEKRWYQKRWLYLLILVGGPMVIYLYTQLVKAYPALQPLWSVGELLSYYGFILGTTTTMFALVIGFHNNRVQAELTAERVRAEARLEALRALIDEIVLALNPDHVSLIVLGARNRDSYETEFKLTEHSVSIRNLLDRIKLHLSPDQYAEMGGVMDAVVDFYQDLNAALRALIEHYQQARPEADAAPLLSQLSELDKGPYQRLIANEREFMNHKVTIIWKS